MSITLEDLRATWIYLYTQTLPSLARARAPAQPKWPVTLDHCFARIILDNTVGNAEEQWDKRLERPAVKNMTEEQLRAAIELGGKIERGEVGLVELDQRSLECRGKRAKYGKASTQGKETVDGSEKKRKFEDAEEATNSDSPSKKAKSIHRQNTLSFKPSPSKPTHPPSPPASDAPPIALETKSKSNYHPSNYLSTLHKIRTLPTLTTYRRRLYTTLLSVPAGRYTTYAALSEHLSSCARAVGNGMRNNPFAPEVPCHRVLAADGSIGGFKGDWGKDGKHASKKIELLRGEGVRFDGKGRVVGEVFRGFHGFEGD